MVQVLDATGRMLRHQRLPRYGNTHQAQIALGGLPAGTYYVRIVHEEINILKPLIKN
jgi:hypothetical protein